MKLRHRMTLAVATMMVVAAGGGSFAATADSADAGAAPDTGEKRASDGTPVSKMGLAILAGGGVTDFTQGTTRDETRLGGTWDVRVTIATRHWIGFEASYIGSASPIQGLGLPSNSKLVRNGIEGALRVQAPLRHQSMLLEPYILGGVGWNAYRVTNVDASTASVSTNSDNTLVLPFGVGFMIGYKGFVGDVRYTVRPTYQQTLLSNQGANDLTNWDAGAMIGFEF
jgi:hypothetical protein